MRGRAIASLVLGVAAALAMAAAIAGCATPSNTTNTTSSGTGTQTVPVSGVSTIIADWAESTHSVPVVFAAQQSPCAGCHDGRGFAMGVTDPKSLNATAPFGPYVVATDCRACHTGQGAAYLRSGEVTTPTDTTSTIKAGTGAVCIACHRERSVPSVSANPEAPHPSIQAAVYLGYGGFRRPGVAYGSTTQHQKVKNMCVGCHMSDVNGVPTHTFMPPSDPAAICGACHQGVTSYNRPASADYDGDGKVQGIQDEVKGLLGKLDAASVKAMGSGATTLTQVEGRIVFKSGSTTVTAPIPNKVYQAAYNWALITNDKSFGVHNPEYTVQLLQQSYIALTGSPIPNSKPFPGTTEASATGTSSTPSGGATGGGAGGATTAP